jgi:HEAT repeat protein
VRANAATAIGSLGTKASSLARTIAALLRDDDPRVRIASARAIDQFGDDAVVATAADLVGGMRGDAEVAEACRAVLAARGAKIEAALVAGLETPDEIHGMRLAQLIITLPNARETLFIAFDGPAQNVQLNAAIGIGLLGDKAGLAGWRRLKAAMAGPLTRRREVMVKALAMLGPEPTT